MKQDAISAESWYGRQVNMSGESLAQLKQMGPNPGGLVDQFCDRS
jgi:hypothetical protein